MTERSSASIPKPRDWQDFERNCCVLFECLLEDDGVKRNGTSGPLSQNGVDLYGRYKGKGTEWVGIQCKQKKEGKKVERSELRKEVEEAKKFKPALSKFILTTTASDNVEIDEEARLITHENEVNGTPFSVVVWGWETLEEKIIKYQRAYEAFHPDASALTTQVIKNQEQLKDDSSEIKAKLDILIQDKRLIQTTDGTSAATEELDKALHARIDKYRDLIKEGRPRTALQLLESLKEEIWDSASDRIKFRLITNIGSAKLEFSNEQEAIEHFLDAIKYQPEDKIALANVALAYLLQKEPAQAIDAARKALKKDENNAEAASYLIQAHIKDKGITDPLGLVPEAVKGTASVDIAVINFYRTRNDSKWVEAARDGLSRNSDNEQIIRFAAEAELENALTTEGLFNGQKPKSDIDFEALRQAARALQTLWDKQYNSEHPGADSSLPYNLTQLYRTIGENGLAKTVVAQAIEKMPDAQDVIKLRVGFYLENDKTRDAATLLQKLRDDTESILMLAEIQANQDPIAALDTLEDIEKKKNLEDRHRILAGGIRIDSWLAHPELSTEDRIENARKEYKALNKGHPNTPLISLMYSQILEMAGQDEAMNEALENAKTLLTSASTFYERYLVARRFESLDRSSDVADVLDGYVDPSYDSPPLRILFFSLINSDRRAQAFELLSAMPRVVAEKPAILHAAISLHFRRGDYAAAESAINKFLKIQPKSLRTHLNRIDIWLKHRNDKAIQEFLETNVEELEGNPEEFMRVAHLLDRYGLHERALALGYKTHLESSRNPKVQLAYIGLLLRPNSSSKVDLERTAIGVGTAFTIKNTSDANETETFIVEEDEALRLVEQAVEPTHPFVAAAAGCTIGDKFTDLEGEEWEIISIKHKYLHSLHQRMDRFGRQFPENGGLRRFTIKEGSESLEPILKSVKEKHDSNESILDKYAETPLPLEVFAEWLGTDVIEAWYGLAQVGRKFKVCHGNRPEREAAVKTIEENDKSGCVVDALTLHIIRTLDIEEIIIEVCGPIAVTESTKDTFRYRIEQVQAHGEQPFMTMYWRDGHYYRDEVTTERIKNTLAEHIQELDWIDQQVEVLPAESSQIVPEEAGRIRDALSYDFLDPILAAQSSNRLLLCEDQSYRQFGVTAFGIKGTWLQPVLMLALAREIISKEKYSEVICSLVRAGHTFTSIDTTILQYALEKGENEFQIAAKALFGLNAEIGSHRRVMAAFLYGIWTKGIDPALKEKMATSILLRRLFLGEWKNNFEDITNGNIRALLAPLLALLDPLKGKRFFDYLSGWLTGHFVVLGDEDDTPSPKRQKKMTARRKKRR